MSLGSVRKYMTEAVHSLEPGHSVKAAHRLMERHNVHHMPVLEKGELKGVATMRDLYILASLRGVEDDDLFVSEAMQQVVLKVSPTDGVVAVCRQMAEARTDVAMVMEGGHVAGIFTSHDALKVVADANPR